VTDDTSSKFVDNEFQDDLWAWGSARNDVEENTLRGFVIDGDATAGYVVGNTIRDNVAHGKTKVKAGAAGAAAGGAPRHAREARGRLWLRSGVRAVMHALGAPHAGGVLTFRPRRAHAGNVIIGNEADYMLMSDADYNVLRENTVRMCGVFGRRA
jgi:hypothetical protein